jgi:hypothetical protein
MVLLSMVKLLALPANVSLCPYTLVVKMNKLECPWKVLMLAYYLYIRTESTQVEYLTVQKLETLSLFRKKAGVFFTCKFFTGQYTNFDKTRGLYYKTLLISNVRQMTYFVIACALYCQSQKH